MQKSSLGLAGLGFDKIPELLKPEETTRAEKEAEPRTPVTPPLDVAAVKAVADRLEALLPFEAQKAIAAARAAKDSAPEDYEALTEKAWALVPSHQKAPLLDAWRSLRAAEGRKPEPVGKVAPAAPATPRNPEPGDEWVTAYDYPPRSPAVASAPSSTGTDPSIPLPGQTPSSPPDTSPPSGVAAPAAGGCDRPRKKGRPRLHPDRVLTQQEKARRYRQRRKAVAARAMSGGVDVATMSHKDLCLAVARILNRRNDLELRQTGYPLVKELQRRLKNL